MLSATPLSPVLPSLQGALVQNQSALASGAATSDDLPYPEAQTFKLHSDPTATKTIYLDFVGYITRNTAINSQYGVPNIVTPPFSLDSDLNNFSPDEEFFIQTVWERVSEDFRPFGVDVTTEDPGVEALRKDGSGTDTAWGIRVVIGGSTYDWFTPVTGTVKAGVSIQNSFTSSDGTPAFVFANELQGVPEFAADVASNLTGATLGLSPDGQKRDYFDISDPDMTKWSWKTVTATYYNGHPDPPTGDPTNWGPIMGTPYGQQLTQWSQGEYPGATNIQDDLAIITSPNNGVGYRADDHGNTISTADPLTGSSSATNTIDVNVEGIIERNTDKDVFSFTVSGLGEVDQFDISPFYNGANLDVLAKILDSLGNVLYTSNPRDEIDAGSQTLGDTNSDGFADGGWLDVNSGEYTDELFFQAGTYYLSVEGTGRPITFIDPVAHPNPQTDPPGPNDKKVPDASDWGYTKYGSLGYYNITGTRKSGLVIGVDFDTESGAAPTNWNSYTGSSSSSDTLTGLISESGASVPYQLSISTTGTSITPVADGAPIASSDIPDHAVPLDDLDGYIPVQNQTVTFTWSNLEPWTFHQIYVFGHADTFDAHNIVTITGGELNGSVDTQQFTQIVGPCGLEVNSGPSGNTELSAFAYKVLSDGNGQITISVTNEAGYQGGIAGLAILSTQPIGPVRNGSITGHVWNDKGVGGDSVGAGNGVRDAGEPGAQSFIVYLDENNNGELDRTVIPAEPDQTFTQSSDDIPQLIEDYIAVKSDLNIAAFGQIVDLNVKLNISHTYDSDLHVTLISPLGTEVVLFANAGAQGINFTDTVLDDSAIIPLSFATAPFTGTFRPQNPLSVFNGQEVHGTWKLRIYDDSAGDTGVLNSWSITATVKGTPEQVTLLEPHTTTDANGFYSFTNLTPGVYHVREYLTTQQVAAGWVQTFVPSPLTLRSGALIQSSTDQSDFGNWIPISQTGSIRGRLYYDADQDGVKDAQEPGLAGRVVFLDTNNNGIRDISVNPVVVSSINVPIPIPDEQQITSTTTVGSLGTVFHVEVTLDITHTFVGDLKAVLRSPSGKEVTLFNGVGGQFNNFHNLTLSDDAARSINTIGVNDLAPGGYTGTWQPEGLVTGHGLGDFAGENAAGTWSLIVTDGVQADQGVLNSWSLKFTSGEIYRTTDADGYYEFNNMVPGQYIVRVEPKTGWTSIPPGMTEIPAAVWGDAKWTVTLVGVDDFNDPNGPDSHRNVRNVDFANYAPPGSIEGYVYNDGDGNSAQGTEEPGLSGWTVFIDSTGNGSLDLQSIDHITYSNTPATINSFFPVSSKLWIGDLATITHINVQLDISHTYDSDLTVTLRSPAGTPVRLFTHVGANGHNFTQTVFSDDAFAPISGGSAPFDSVYKPEQALSAFNGESAIGFWTLEITDDSPANDTGNSLNFWGIEIIGNELTAVTDELGHYSFGNLPPGIYAVNTVQKSDWTRTEVPGSVTVGPGQGVVNVNFGNQSAGSVPILLGDYNLDGFVNGADYVMFRRTLGSTVAKYSGADGDGSGVVDMADFGVWRAHFGQTLGAGAANVMAGGAGTGDLDEAGGASRPGSSASLAVEAASPVLVSNQSAGSLEPRASASSLASPVFVAQGLPPTTQAADSSHNSLNADAPVGKASSSDLGLLAWIAASPEANQAGALLSDYDLAGAPAADESSSFDAALETLEDSALVTVTI